MEIKDIKEIKDIRRIAALMKPNDLTELSIKDGAFKLTVKRGGEGVPQVVYAPPPAASTLPEPADSPPATPETIDNTANDFAEITSPIIGTFYRRSAPDTDNFVEAGDKVLEDTTVCIVEAMKVMNEIKAGVRGIIRKILAEDTAPVQYGQPLFQVELE